MFKKEAEDYLKYKDHTMETQRVWNVKTKVIPATIGTIGTYTRSLRKCLKECRKPRNQGSTENNHIEHFTHNSGSINFKVQNIQHRK